MAAAFEIRPARGRQGRRLLPEAFAGGGRPNLLLLAFEPGRTEPVGAAALAPRGRRAQPAGPRFGVRVRQEFRGRGAARALLERALRAAARRGAQALYSWAEHADEDPLCRLWERLGFAERKTVCRYETSSARLQELTAPLRGGLPAGCTIVPPAPEHYERIVKMRLRMLGGHADQIRARLRGAAPKPYSTEISVVLEEEGKVAGALLAVLEAPARASVDAILVAPRRRGSRAAMALVNAALERARAAGVETALFEAHPSHRFTQKLAERAGAKVVGRTHAFYRLLGEAAPAMEAPESDAEVITPPDFRIGTPGSF